MLRLLRAGLALALVCSPALASAEEAAGPEGFGGTLLPPAPYATTVVIVPGKAGEPATYHALAEALNERGFGSLLLDTGRKPKREAVAASVLAVREATGSPCIWLLGHGSGANAALAAAEEASGLCGVMLVAAPGGRKTARLAARLSLPLMIVSGGQDTVAGADEGAALRAAQPDARHAMVLEMDHLLRAVEESGARTALSAKLPQVLTTFMFEEGPQVQGSLDAKPRSSGGSRRAALDRGPRPIRS